VFLYLLGTSEPGSTRPPRPTGLPAASKMGKSSRERKASLSRPARLTVANPASRRTSWSTSSALTRWSKPSGRPPEAVPDHDLLVVTAIDAQVAAGSRAVGCLQQPLVVPLDGLFECLVDLGLLLVFASAARVAVVQGDPGLGGQAFHCLDEVQLVDLAHEGDDVALGAAAEAVVEALLGVEGERRRLLGVERAQSGPAGADLAQRHLFAGDGLEVGLGSDPGHVLLRDRHGA
jgi:hypothetical protein